MRPSLQWSDAIWRDVTQTDALIDCIITLYFDVEVHRIALCLFILNKVQGLEMR